jgi:hypothetical protein
MNTPNPYARPPSGPTAPNVGSTGDFAIGELLGEAWRLSDGCKASFLAVYAAMFVVLWLTQAIVATSFGLDALVRAAPLSGVLWQLLLAAAIYPFLAGVMALALRRVDGLPVKAADALSHGVRLGEAILLGVLLTLATGIGFALLLLPGIYLSVALMFALPLLVDRRLGAIAAMKASLAAVKPRWFRCAGLLLVLGILLALGSLVIVGLVWVLPVSSLALALAYRRLFPAVAGTTPTTGVVA